jgi:hypothetical protein
MTFETNSDPLALLRPNEERIPFPVLHTITFLASLDIAFAVSRNVDAWSCADAAAKRCRDGQIGIPIFDEMKSLFCRADIPEDPLRGFSRFSCVIAHCRGDRRIDFGRLGRLFRSRQPPRLLSLKQLRRVSRAYGVGVDLSLDYGTVNPFDSAYVMDGPFTTVPVWQAFDLDLLKPVAPPGTVMTNAGSRTWAVEFRAQELFSRLNAVRPGAVRAARISVPDSQLRSSGVSTRPNN